MRRVGIWAQIAHAPQSPNRSLRGRELDLVGVGEGTIRSLSPSAKEPQQERDTDGAKKDEANTLFGKIENFPRTQQQQWGQ